MYFDDNPDIMRLFISEKTQLDMLLRFLRTYDHNPGRITVIRYNQDTD